MGLTNVHFIPANLREYNRRMRRLIIFILFAEIVLGAIYRGRLIRVIDGDTIYAWVEGFGRVKIRLIGIDAPEKEIGRHALRQTRRWHKPPEEITYLGWRAKQFLKRLLPKHSMIKVETDVEIFDDYGRLLAYIWKGSILINEVMVREGYASVYTFPPNVKYVERFIKAQKKAQSEGKGIWAPY